MSLETGTRLGPYEVLGAIGAGGMGEVYRARDTRLKRDVALKVLPDGFATDPDRLGRFHREAELLAQLNHPNIASIYGLEQTDATTAIILELIEGDTLADLIARGPLMMSAALPIARQVAEALEAAHEKGVIHRDLKPANIKVTGDGKVKVLDFGLATVVERPTTHNINATHSPTLTLATQAGVILGTAAYMSPEQASGAIADKRADVWAFGVVLWEMLTGRRLFDGETVSHTLAYVLTKEPDWTTLPTNTPTSIRRLLRRSLEKDRKRRLPEFATARMELDDALSAPAGDAPAATVGPAPAGPRWRGMPPWAFAAAAIIALGMILALWAPWRKAGGAPLVRVTVDIGADASLVVGGAPAANLALSSDGKLLAYVASSGGNATTPQLFVRRLDQLQATSLSGTGNATNPFFSPDSQWIAFFADGKLKKISATGGGAITLCDAPNGRGGAWGDDGTIVFAGNSTPGSGLLRVREAGGKPEPLTTPRDGETLHRWPQLLGSGKTVLFTAAASAGSFGDANIVVETIPSGPRKIVLRGGYFGRYLPSGHLIYMHDSTLFAAPFDLDRLEITGQAFPVIEGVAASTGTGGVQLATSTSGTLAYLAGAYENLAAPIVWVDRSGQTSPLQSMASNWSNPQFSPDGTRLAIDIAPLGASPDVWIYDWQRDTSTRLTFDPGLDLKPVWTPDGKRIVFSSSRSDQATLNLYWQRADGTGDAQRLTESKNNQFAASWSPDGRFLAFHEQSPQTGMDIMILPVDGNEASGWKIAKPTVFLSTMFAEQEPMFSPDGHWLAYFANDSGQGEVYVRPFPGPGGLQQISSGGGAWAMWSRTKPELFFTASLTSPQIMVASYTTTADSFSADKPRLVAPTRSLARPRLRPLNLHPDGQRFAAAPAQNPQAVGKQDKLVLIFNFFDELKRIAPAAK